MKRGIPESGAVIRNSSLSFQAADSAGVAFPHIGPFSGKKTVLELVRRPHPFRRAHGLILLFIPVLGFGKSPGFFDNSIHIQQAKWYLGKTEWKSAILRTVQKI